MVTNEQECFNCGCNLYKSCEGYEGEDMSGKMMLAVADNCEVYTRTDDGGSIFLEIDDPQHFEADKDRIMVKIPLEAWVYLVEQFQRKHNRHVDTSDKQLKLFQE